MSAKINELQQNVITSLSEFVKTGSADLLNWLIDLETKHNGLFNNEVIIDSYWSTLVRNGPHDPNLIAKLIELTPYDLKPFLITKLTSLILTKDPNAYSTLIDMIPNKEFKIPDNIITKLRDSCLQVASEINPPHNFKLYEIVIRSRAGSDYYELKELANKILLMIENTDPNIQNNVFNLLRLINEKLDSNNEQFGVENCIDVAKKLLDNSDVKAEPYLNFIVPYVERIYLRQKRQFFNLLEEQLTIEKPWNISSICLNCIIQLNDSDKKDFFNTILEFAKSNQDNAIKERCRQVLLTIKEFTSRQREKMIESFGENAFN